MLTLVKFFSAKNFPPNGDIHVVCYLSILVHYAAPIQPLNIFYPNVTPCEIMYRKAGSTITSNYSYSIVPGKNLHSLVPEKMERGLALASKGGGNWLHKESAKFQLSPYKCQPGSKVPTSSLSLFSQTRPAQ